MANVFASLTQKQTFMDGVQAELRDSLPMEYVSDINTEDTEYIYNRYGSDISAQSTPNATYRRNASFSYDKDSFLIDQEATAPDVITYRELTREGFDLVADRTDRHAEALREAVHDHAFHTTRLGAGSTLDNEVLAGSASAGTPITMSSSNPDDVASMVNQILQQQNAFGGGNPYVMMSPKQARFFNLFSMGAGFSVADKALTSGYFTVGGGTRVIRGASAFNGLDVVVTNRVQKSVVLTFADETDEGDTIVITVGGGAVTLTCDASPDGAGDYDQGGAGDEEATIDAVVALINNSDDVDAATASTTSGLYYELSQADRTILQDAGVRARKLTSSTMEISAFDTSLVVTETGDEVTVGTHKEHMLAGAYNSTTIALPSTGMHVDEKPLASTSSTRGTNGYELVSTQQHDAVVWTKMAPKIIDILAV